MNGVELDTCGCRPSLPAPPRIWNRPGLELIDYRISTHPAVLGRLIARLDAAGRAVSAGDGAATPDRWLLIADTIAEELPAGEPTAPGATDTVGKLAALTTRESDDPAIALLDAYAIVADVLSFYQERIANEGYLRTATERRSLLELARLIGYELAPGVAAHAWLAFEVEERLEEGPISSEPPRATVPARTRLQSVPEAGELPQTFETSEELEARAERNAMRPRLTVPQPLNVDAETIYLRGTATGLSPGDWMVLAAGTGEGPIDGAPEARRVHRVVVEPERDRTRVDFANKPAALSTPTPSAQPTGVVTLAEKGFGKTEVEEFLGSSWSNAHISTFLMVHGWSAGALHGYTSAAPKPPPQLPAAAPGAYALRQRAGIFGHNAPKHSTALTQSGWANDWDATARGVDATTKNSQGTTVSKYDPPGVDLEAVLPRIVSDSWAVLVESRPGVSASPKVVGVSKATEISRADYAISAKATHLDLVEADGSTATGLTEFGFRTTTVHAESERLELAELPLPETLAANTNSLELDRLVLGLEVGQPVAIRGEDAELDGVRWGEVVRLTEITHAGGRTTLHFAALERSYKRSTVTVNANVLEATHGETVEQPLGSGDGAAHQRFALRKPPLTHVASTDAAGAESTLELRVDGILWERARGLYGLGPTDERYVVRRDDDARTEVVFGDGERGARPPTGFENVTARYRSGIGLAGLVGAGEISLLQNRPPGIREVINPLPAAGAEDPESRDSARANAPLTVMTLDRVVALADYEAFAHGFAGIAKARATALWLGERQVVHVTVAAPGGGDVAAETRAKLLVALRRAGDPGVEVRIGAFRKLPFELRISVLLDERHEPEAVLDAVREALAASYSFERREFGQGVSEAEVISTALAVEGARDARVEVLRLLAVTGAPTAEKQDPLLARLARWSETQPFQVEPAELLMLSPLGAEVVERSEA